ncbi:MAG: dolichyl-phosphate beta-glucosyltransferase [Patescibacteria group bacterium]
MPQSDIYLSVIVPAYNEEDRIRKTLKRFQEYFSSQPYSYEILVVNDGSRDRTTEVVQEMVKEVVNLNFIDRKKNKGKGFSVREGILNTQGKIRLFADADNATDISHFDKMRHFFDKGYDVVIASRDSKDAPGAKQAVPQPWHKRFLGNLGNLYIQRLAVKGIWDTQCGFKAFRDYAADKIFRASNVNGWMFDVEALALARKFNFKIGIIPANWINDPKTHVKFSSYLKSLLEVLKISRRIKNL